MHHFKNCIVLSMCEEGNYYDMPINIYIASLYML